MVLHVTALAVLIAIQNPPTTTGTTPRQQTPASASSSARTGSIDLTVTGPTGALLSAAAIRADGATPRQGTTGDNGHVVLTNVAPGAYRCRIERDGFVTFEKEIVVKAGAATTADIMLSAAPAPRVVGAPMPQLTPGIASVMSLLDTAEQLMKAVDPVAEKSLGCSGATYSRLVRVKDVLPSTPRADADEMIYVVAGEAAIVLNGKEQLMAAGSFAIVPRGATSVITRRGRNSGVVLLSIVSGPPCK